MNEKQETNSWQKQKEENLIDLSVTKETSFRSPTTLVNSDPPTTDNIYKFWVVAVGGNNKSNGRNCLSDVGATISRQVAVDAQYVLSSLTTIRLTNDWRGKSKFWSIFVAVGALVTVYDRQWKLPVWWWYYGNWYVWHSWWWTRKRGNWFGIDNMSQWGGIIIFQFVH